MPTFQLDGRDVPFEDGDSILRAAHRAGHDIPHYCWHPGLSVAANCRMCLVELLPPPGRPALTLKVLRWDPETKGYIEDQKPKLVPACQQPAAAGMVVLSDTSSHVRRARASVQEFLLLNHPVDCPICDQSGECRLQDYWLLHQQTKKRMRDEPIHKPKAVIFGPHIVYDAERCIVCTRCIRVSEELAKDPVLSVRERGNLNEITVAPGRSLDHPYSLMTEHVCPVGALTATEFRFKRRVWFLRSAETICQGCATGCNAYLDYDPRNQTVYRHRPRENPLVNQYWMCDEGMLSYRRAHEQRVLQASVKGKPRSLEAALAAAARRLDPSKERKLGVLLSAQHSSEDNYAVLALGRRLGATGFYMTGLPNGEGDDILRHPNKNPNARGVLLLLPDPPGQLSDLASAIRTGAVNEVLALGSRVSSEEAAEAFTDLASLVVLAVHQGLVTSKASVVLPASSWAEADGTFFNAKGMAQLSRRAILPQGDSLPAWKLVTKLAERLGLDLGWRKASELGQAMSGVRTDAGGARAGDPGVVTGATQ